ncbi:4-hydroxythreonine-4-phosphate dehydrogenase PdxA [Naumannella cuiyingiana]|uniref:4-hydroxythreonine-4-phosphate dehydrogenase n=1 Tax=Naumannella cuiyingiana TaxID=1347891 RepID=A0A7Z0IL61_9ACTN|nr:4-hydroxythreonine-4-phosphate dehydrogenase PdxA [Naumannella cuiyingiana]NYI71253.1 4-hydroxythreonine-4-phosphate dehydrogenase [Naumannella cuiyingiana]
MTTTKPRIALILGDPAGVGPELVAKALADERVRGAADHLLVSDEAELAQAQADAGVEFPWSRSPQPGVPLLIDNGASRPEQGFPRAQASREGGEWVLANFRRAFELVREGLADAVVFAPLNKTSLHLAEMPGRDEMDWFETVLDDGTRATELNILPELTTARVTSHIPLSKVAAAITEQLIIERATLLRDVLVADGTADPRIGVCALNPHAGDNGNYGSEEGDLIAPAVAALREAGIRVEGPIPSDTIFIRALQHREFDGVLTMYHDQGQIAMKLTGFDRGVTMAGGLSVPVCTPAHGTAFNIVGRGEANPGAYLRALEVARAVASRPRAAART